MGKLVIHHEKVTKENAQQLIKLCPFNAFEYHDQLSITSACRMCKLCVRKGPAGVMEFVEEETVQIDKSKWQGISIFIEHDEEKIHPVSFELIGKARELAQVINHPVYAVLICRDADLFAPEILSYGVDRIFVYEEERLAHFNVERYTNCMADFIEKIKPSVVLYGGTATGRSFAPRVASRFRTGLTADCTILGMKKNTDLIQNRPAFGGNIMASIICPNTRPQMATVRYKIFKMPEKEAPHGTIQKMELSFDLSSRLELLEVKAKDAIVDISEAEVLVAVGRAFKTKEDLALAQELADLLGGQVATTRPLIEAGLMDAKKQIGLSGRTVAPKLLITLGVSGAVQFTAGMSGSETVFSVNLDKNAPIFDCSHYGIVGDVFQIVPELIKKIKAGKGWL
ncbi:MAG: electron transfer flavoprotein subunit alpha/FixB family protein [Bacilli bacterium]|jgi:electron transfer flavoprotein alpha subunit|nr:electron transfer flavoprotein subunit alpha/FixB family protein [Bacilli bacterium]MDY0064338.1 electron transfer flavoprotein subunit alpha/FixB family protein [Bacilli bacterium]